MNGIKKKGRGVEGHATARRCLWPARVSARLTALALAGRQDRASVSPKGCDMASSHGGSRYSSPADRFLSLEIDSGTAPWC